MATCLRTRPSVTLGREGAISFCQRPFLFDLSETLVVVLLVVGNTALERSQTGELDISLPDEILPANMLKYSDRSSTELGVTALRLRDG